jgi:hypothetical protein
MRAAELQIVREDLAFWQAYEPAVKCDLSCCARLLGKEFVLIDPIPLSKDALAELTSLATPTAIILTNGNHARAAAWYRDRFGIPIHAHAAADPELGLTIDHPLAEGRTAPGGLEVVGLGGAPAGEIALCGGGAIHVGDALIHLEPLGFALLPDKYAADPRAMRRSLGKLLRFNFELLTFAHGLPLTMDAHQRLSDLLA